MRARRSTAATAPPLLLAAAVRLCAHHTSKLEKLGFRFKRVLGIECEYVNVLYHCAVAAPSSGRGRSSAPVMGVGSVPGVARLFM